MKILVRSSEGNRKITVIAELISAVGTFYVMDIEEQTPEYIEFWGTRTASLFGGAYAAPTIIYVTAPYSLVKLSARS